MILKRAVSCMLVILLLGCLLIPVCADELPEDLSVTNGCHGIDAEKAYLGTELLTENVKSAFLYEINSDSLLYEWNGDLPQYPASFVKIMTALLVLENADLSSVVTVSQNTLNSVSSDAISADLLAGEQITVENLMYCMMVKSANDAAAVLAEFVSGSQEAFVEKMNARAAELGCTGTTYVNPHGLHDDKQVTTARDTCRILREALKIDAFRTFFGTVHYTVPATNLSEERLLATKNYLMNREDDVGIYLDTRVTGGRTGTTTEGYHCIASTAQSGNMDVICIVMGSASTFLEDGYSVDVFGGFPETIALLNHAFEGNAMRQILFRDQILRQYSVLNGECDLFAAVKDDLYTVLPSQYTLEDLSFQYTEFPNSMEAPIEKGQSIGSVQIMYGSSCIAQSELYAANNVAVSAPKAGNYIDAKHGGFPWWIFLIILALLVGAFPTIKRLRSKNQRAESRENHRRRRF